MGVLRHRLLSADIHPVAGEEMPGESITRDWPYNLPVDIQLPANVQVPHVDVSGVKLTRPLLLILQGAERDRVSSHKSALHHPRVLLARFHQGQAVIFQMEKQTTPSFICIKYYY